MAVIWDNDFHEDQNLSKEDFLMLSGIRRKTSLDNFSKFMAEIMPLAAVAKTGRYSDLTGVPNLDIRTKQASVRVTNVADLHIGGVTTGTLKITLPVTWNSTMFNIELSGYDYSTQGAFKLILGGYNYAAVTRWDRCSAILITSQSTSVVSSVRFGHDGSKCCILLGSSTSNWSYISMLITSVVCSFAGRGEITTSGWLMSRITDETGITISATPTLMNYAALATTTTSGLMTAVDKLRLDNTPTYEEGNFNPNIAGDSPSLPPTYTYQEGRYFRLGNKVFISISIAGSWASTPKGEWVIVGLPFIAFKAKAFTGSSIVRYNLVSNPMKIVLNRGENILRLINEPRGSYASFGTECATDIFEITVNMSYLIN